MKSKFANSFDGVKIHYQFKPGKPKKTPLVFLHCLTGDSWNWKREIAFFSKRDHPCLAIDLRCHGKSACPINHDYSMESFAKDVNAVLMKEKIKNAIVIGHSIGSIVGVEFYELYPKKVNALVLINAPHTNQRPKKIWFYLNSLREIFSIKRLRFVVQTAIATQKLGVNGLNTCLDQMYEFDLHKVATKVKVPVLIMASLHDYICPLLESLKIEREIKKNKRLVVLPYSHHLSVVENPKEVSKRILEFLEEMKIK